MWKINAFLMVCAILLISGFTYASDVILNEYNAVSSSEFLNGGNAAADADGGRASDSYFGRVQGNGGDWFELVVITDHLDMREWKFDIYDNGSLDETLDLTDHSIWSDLRSGTIITVSEDLPSDISYNPAAGDWWINVQASDSGDGLYIEDSSFPVSSNNWQLIIRNKDNTVIFGPAGEGVSPVSGIGNTDIFRLEAKPSASIVADSPDYDDGINLSTFGSPNQWGLQDLNRLRTVVAESSELTLLSPNGSEVLTGGITYDITWSYTGIVDSVLIEFSIDNGNSWVNVFPPNVGNTGSYKWLVPLVDSNQCIVRINNSANMGVYDVSDEVFSIYDSSLEADLAGDGFIGIVDFATVALSWLRCSNPYDIRYWK
ncbi:MAG: hypothetical protein JW715_16230 [Sedimentisphaerales bacterium]|nr:hypothetical protein [Sedimentisphaerales bacterium]